MGWFPLITHDTFPSTVPICGTRSLNLAGARLVQRSSGSDRWVSTSITFRSDLTAETCVRSTIYLSSPRDLRRNETGTTLPADHWRPHQQSLRVGVILTLTT